MSIFLESRMTENPFFESWTTPFGMPPFDRIRPEHFPPAFDRGMAEQIAEVTSITGSAGSPSFANTIEALERSGRLLDRVSRVFFNLDSSNTNDALEAVARDYAPRLAQHQHGAQVSDWPLTSCGCWNAITFVSSAAGHRWAPNRRCG